MNTVMKTTGGAEGAAASGEIVDFQGERYYRIDNVDHMAPFFVSVISDDDHWLFVSSTGGLTAGRVSPENALFPYVTVDKIHDGYLTTGCRTVIRTGGDRPAWEPFNREQDGRYTVSRRLYKNLLGNKLCFEEVNHDLELLYRYTWMTSDRYGFVRACELIDLSGDDRQVSVLDGMQNILPAGTPRFTQTNSSNLVDAYKWTELDEDSGLACFALYSGISDRAEPCESLRTNTVFSLGLDAPKILLSNEQFAAFRLGAAVETETHTRGIRGAYFAQSEIHVPASGSSRWSFVANLGLSQSQAVALRLELADRTALAQRIDASIGQGSDGLARIMASADGFQVTDEENVSGHHYSNVLFNVLRGGIFDDQYFLSGRDLSRTIRLFNRPVYERNRALLDDLGERLRLDEALAKLEKSGDAQLHRLVLEYLPITFGRRHGDPSRPWNQFAIQLKDEHGNSLLSYQGNWRDIFQNWEALAISYPAFLPAMIAKFVNASTMDGYNPYRITKEGIDWEVEEPDDPWSYIGYWGDHQIIYLLKLLELSDACYPAQLESLLTEDLFAYANVPYRIRPYAEIVKNPKDTVTYDDELAARIEARVGNMGSDGKLVLDVDGNVLQVNLVEKLLVPLLSKLGNFVVDGGIWMNTQRPEWNDANNALVGNGLSMVTLYYMRRYIVFLHDLLKGSIDEFALSSEVAEWLGETTEAMQAVAEATAAGAVSEAQRKAFTDRLGEAADHYRRKVYAHEGFAGRDTVSFSTVDSLLEASLAAIDRSIESNRRDDGLYEAYNLIEPTDGGLAVDHLYLMLEGQVGALSSGAVSPADAAAILEAMFESELYRPDQKTFLLYPDRSLPGFLERNRIPEERATALALVRTMLDREDRRILERDPEGHLRFHADFVNAADLEAALDDVAADYAELVAGDRQALLELYEDVFDHRAFTGRSGTMFGFEGLGSVYWHMVSKLLLAAMEVFFKAVGDGAPKAELERLGALYYRVREGIGFNKTPAEYGAFPLDPYSHTPKHAGASQPGMTGQVKEEIVARFAELGIRISDGGVRIQPALLRRREFRTSPGELCYLDVANDWQSTAVPVGGLGFTWCQVPIIYELSDDDSALLTITMADGSTSTSEELVLDAATTHEIIERSGRVTAIHVRVPSGLLLSD